MERRRREPASEIKDKQTVTARFIVYHSSFHMSSPTVPTAEQSESDVLDVRADVWRRRPLLRDIYRRYFEEMVAHLSPHPNGGFGLTVEIGGGSGNFKDYFLSHHGNAGRLIATDVVPTRHCDLTADAMEMPFPDASVDNLVMMDVLHHIPFPLRFFAEARRVLRPGGRIVMTEPYISPASRVIYAIGHPEPVVTSAQIFGKNGAPDPCPLRGSGAFASNQATPTLLFFRDRGKFANRFPELQIRERLRRSLIVFPLSGGFSGPTLIPRFLLPTAWTAERLLAPLAGLLACRVLIVIERTA
jgi:SAM-dependent methyltransferase